MNEACTRRISADDYIASLAKGMAVLECFDTERQKMNATVAAQRANITRAAARRYLLTLEVLGYLESDGSFFWLTPRVLRAAGSYLSSARLPRAIQPALNRLAHELQQAVSVAVLDGQEVVVIGRSGPTKLLAYGAHLGARLPAYATSTGRVLLASLQEEDFQDWMAHSDLRRLTAATVTVPKALNDMIKKAGADDFCVAIEEHEVGVYALAVPLRDFKGRTVAALNVIKPMGAPPSEEEIAALLASLRAAASEVRGTI